MKIIQHIIKEILKMWRHVPNVVNKGNIWSHLRSIYNNVKTWVNMKMMILKKLKMMIIQLTIFYNHLRKMKLLRMVWQNQKKKYIQKKIKLIEIIHFFFCHIIPNTRNNNKPKHTPTNKAPQKISFVLHSHPVP